MEKSEKMERCPYCGAMENVIGKQTGYATISPDKMLSLKGEILYYLICLNCGNVIRSYVKNPKRLVVKK